MLRALILAAGCGKRLGSASPKCLLRFGGQTLLQRHFAALERAGVSEIAIVDGYESQQLEWEVMRLGAKVELILNPDYALGSTQSVWCARGWLRRGGEVLLMDADVLYEQALIDRLVRHAGNALLIDRAYEDREQEAVKVCLRGGRIVELRKRLHPDLAYDDSGESVGFFRLTERAARDLAARCDDYVRGGRAHEPHEEVLRDLLLARDVTFDARDVTGLAWLEIDFPADVERGRREVLPRIDSCLHERRIGA